MVWGGGDPHTLVPLAQEAAPGSLGRAGGRWEPCLHRNTGSSAGGSPAGHSHTPATGLVLWPPPRQRVSGWAARTPSPPQKALPGPGLFDTLLHGSTQGCKACLAPSISCQHPARRLGSQQGSAGCSRASCCCGQTEGTDSRCTPGQPAGPRALHARSESTSCPQQGQAPVLRGAAIAGAPGPGHEETGRETNLFQTLSACLGPIFRIFCSANNLTQNLIWTKIHAGLHFFSISPKITACFSRLPCRGPGRTVPGSSRQPVVPSQDPTQRRPGTKVVGKEQERPLF